MDYKISSHLRKSLINYLVSRPIGEAMGLFNLLVSETQDQPEPIKPVSETKDETVPS